MNRRLLQFLELVRHELDAHDARAELGGRDPTDPRLVWHSPQADLRIVAVFDEPPSAPESVRQHLIQLTNTFLGVNDAPSITGTGSSTAQLRLNHTLSALVEHANGVAAAIFDLESGILWGSSLGTQVQEVEPFLLDDPEAEPERRALRRALRHAIPPPHAIRADPAQDQQDTPHYVERLFAGLYHALLVYDDHTTELKATSSLLRALPHLEQLMLALPPIDPGPKGTRVIPLRLRLL